MDRPMGVWTRREWAAHYSITSRKRIYMIKEDMRKQLVGCRDEAARRILLGVSK